MLRQSVGDRILSFSNLLQFIGGKSSGIRILLYDTFTGTDTTALTSHPPNIDAVGGGWQKYTAPVYTLLSNQASNPSSVPGTMNYANVGVANVTATWKFTPNIIGSSHLGGLLVRGSAANTFYVMTLYNGFIRIYETPGLVNRASATFVATVGVQYSLSMSANGNALSFAVSGGPTVTYNSALYSTNTHFGLYSTTSVGDAYRLDDLEILAI